MSIRRCGLSCRAHTVPPPDEPSPPGIPPDLPSPDEPPPPVEPPEALAV